MHKSFRINHVGEAQVNYILDYYTLSVGVEVVAAIAGILRPSALLRRQVSRDLTAGLLISEARRYLVLGGCSKNIVAYDQADHRNQA
jgi:hypothetical protein